MRRIAVLPLLPLLLAVAGAGCGQDAAPKADAKVDAPKADAKVDAPKAEPETKTAVAEPTPTPAPTPTEPEPEIYGGEFCKTIVPCFQALDFSGAFVADVTVDIEPDGSVSSVSFTGEAPQPVQECISKAIERIKLDPYNGKPGRAHCETSGQIMGGTQMIMSDSSYEVRDAGGAAAEDAKADAPADDAKAE